MKHLYKTIGKLILGISLLTTAHLSFACGPILYTDEARFSLFRKETIGNPSLDPFHYSHSFYSGYNHSATQSERAKNIQEWIVYGNKTFSKKGTEILQYETDPEIFLNAYNQHNFSSFDGNDFMEFLLKKDQKEALEYFAYAKQVESAQNFNYGWTTDWNDGVKEFKREVMPDLAETALKKLKKKRLPAFLKERYAFQYVKCVYYDLFYNQNKSRVEKAVEIYDRYLSNSSSIVAQWALIYYADFQANSLDKNLVLLQAFDKSADKRLRAFSLMDPEQLKAIQLNGNDPYYSNLVDIVFAIRNLGKGLEDVKKLYHKNKENQFLLLLMTREINKLEDWIWSNEYLKFNPSLKLEEYFRDLYRNRRGQDGGQYIDTGYNYYAAENLKADIAYLNEVITFYESMNFGTDTIRNNFKDIALVHLYNMKGDHVTAEKKLKSLLNAQTKEATLQIQYEKVITLPQVLDINKQRTKDLIAMNLFGIEENQPKSDRGKWQGTELEYYAKDDASAALVREGDFNIDPQILVYLGRVYLSKGERLIGSLFLQRSGVQTNEYAYRDIYDTTGYSGLAYLEKYCIPEDIDKLLALKKKKSKSMFERFHSPYKWSTNEMYLDLKGTLYLRQGEYAKAIETFEQMSPEFWLENYHFKDHLPLSSVSAVEDILPQPIGRGAEYPYQSKLLIAKDLYTLEQNLLKAKTDDKKAEAYFLYGNALYNISYYGHSWMAYAYGKSSTELYNGWKDIDNYQWTHYYMRSSEVNRTENYYLLMNVIQAYQQAVQYGGKSETAAAAAIMLAYCDQVKAQYEYRQNNPYVVNNSYDYRTPYYSGLKEKYGQTKIMQLAITSCPDIR